MNTPTPAGTKIPVEVLIAGTPTHLWILCEDSAGTTYGLLVQKACDKFRPDDEFGVLDLSAERGTIIRQANKTWRFEREGKEVEPEPVNDPNYIQAECSICGHKDGIRRDSWVNTKDYWCDGCDAEQTHVESQS